MLADIAGYSALMERDESGTFARVRSFREDIVYPQVAEFGGRVIKTTGDGFLAEFSSATAALRCGIAIQRANFSREATKNDAERLHLRIGVNIGDIISDGGDVSGDGVNIAARLEPLAPRGGICLSAAIRDQIREDLGVIFEDIGEQHLKNIARPIRAYCVHLDGQSALPEATLPIPDKPSIAVLPFQNMSSDPEQEHFADGLSEDIITALSRIHSLFVIARNSTFTYKGRSVSVRQVGRELGTRYVLEGSVRKSGNRIRVTSQLVDAENGRHIWAEKYDRPLDDIFEIQDDVTRAVVASVQHEVDLFEGDVVSRDRLDVWSLLKRALRSIYKLDVISLEDAARLAKQAIELDPKSALAHAYLSFALHNLALIRRSPSIDEEQRRAQDLASKAIALDERNEFCHMAFGTVCGWFGETDQAIAALRRALELNPNYSLAWGILGSVLAIAGDAKGSIEACEISIRSNPRDPSNFFRFTSLAEANYMLGQFEAALEWAQKSVERRKDWFRGHHWAIASLVRLGRIAQAQAAVSMYLTQFPQGSLVDVEQFPQKSATNRADLLEALKLAGMPDRPR